MHRKCLATSLILASLALAGCSTVDNNVGACPTPPALKAETIPKPPVSEHQQIWQPGHWEWDGHAYTWQPGAWILRKGRSNLWMDGYWNRPSTPGACVWHPAHWQN